MDMEEILCEVRRNVFEKPKPTIDLEYLYSIKNAIQEYADDTNSQLKQNVYQNYSLFIESSREIATLKEEMRQLNTLLEQQQTSMNRLLDKLHKEPIIQPTLERPEPKTDIFGNLSTFDSNEDDQIDILPEWFAKSPEDFDVLIAQRNLKEAVELVKKVREYFIEYPKCCCNNRHKDLKEKIDNRIQELINVICSELQPVTDRPIQGGPRSSINAIQLLRELNLTSRAVKLYLDLRTSVLRSVLNRQKVTSIMELIPIFSHNIIETCNEFKQAFDLQKNIDSAIEECDHLSGSDFVGTNGATSLDSKKLLFELVHPIYLTQRKRLDSVASTTNGHDISAEILNAHNVKGTDDNLISAPSSNNYQTFYYLSTYASLTYWVTLEFENFASIFRKNVFNNPSPMSLSKIAEHIYSLRKQCSSMAKFCEIDMTPFLERELSNEIRRVIEDSGRNLIEKIKELDASEKWQPQEFRNKTDKTRFIVEMNDVDLKTMSKYITDDLKCHFTTSKTTFARYFLITVNDLAKVGKEGISPQTSLSRALILTNLHCYFHERNSLLLL